ncbi:hypothetical protein RDABS01_001535, partial [Bienertia sinuspersici]
METVVNAQGYKVLALKNLATVFLQQGPAHYENALHCYLQAVEIDTKDSVVWNQLGTLACSMGLLSISRWAFEQGLASEKGQEAYIEKVYEVYGYGGAGFVVEVSTDKVNRSVAAIREVVRDCGGKMADSGSVIFRFNRARVVNVKVGNADKDQLLGIALDAVSSPENYSTVLSKLRQEGVNFEVDNGYELLPVSPIE